MTIVNDDIQAEVLFGFEDPQVKELAMELAQLPPDFGMNTEAHQRSIEIIQAFDDARLSIYQKGQVIAYIRSQWLEAAKLSDSLKLSGHRVDNRSIGQQLSGLCLVRSNVTLARERQLEIAS